MRKLTNRSRVRETMINDWDEDFMKSLGADQCCISDGLHRIYI